MTLNPDIPASVPDATADQIRDAIDNIAALTIENRQYALSREELPDDKAVQTDYDDLPYVVAGEQPLADVVAVAIDDEGSLAMGDDHVRIGVAFASRPGHFKEEGKDYAGRVYDAMAEAGIERPNGNPKAGVQFTRDVVVVENVVDFGGETA